MNKPNFRKEGLKKGLITSLLVLIISLTCNSCFNKKIYNEIFTAKDVVYNTQRYELKHYLYPEGDRNAVKLMIQDLVKEVDSTGITTFTAYDYLELSATSYDLEEKVFIIIDEVAFPMVVDRIELDDIRETKENTSDILTADSSNVSVVTSYSVNNKKIVRIKYEIPETVLEKIKNSQKFTFRYYSGPNMITIPPRTISREKILELIDIGESEIIP